MAENPGMVIDTTDFTIVKKYVDNVIEPKLTIVPSKVTDKGVEAELKFEEGYVKPKVPVIDIDGY
jgi:hypothetical protein